MINIVLSLPGAKFDCFDISNFYLETPLDLPDYVRVKLADIPQYLIEEYIPTKHIRDGWVYFEVRKSLYGLPQSEKIANDLLCMRL